MELIRIDFDKGLLKTPGHEYWISDKISIDRYIEFELLQAGAAYGITFDEIHKAWMDIETALNKVKFTDAAAIIANMKDALIKGANKKNHIILRICALFLNEKDEDVRTCKNEVLDAKIQDWLDNGVCYADFFQLTLKLMPGLLAVLQETSSVILETEQTVTSQIDGLTSMLQTSKEKLGSSGA